MAKKVTAVPTCTHWGNYKVETDGAELLSVQTYATDKEPTLIAQSLLDSLDKNVRIPPTYGARRLLKSTVVRAMAAAEAVKPLCQFHGRWRWI